MLLQIEFFINCNDIEKFNGGNTLNWLDNQIIQNSEQAVQSFYDLINKKIVKNNYISSIMKLLLYLKAIDPGEIWEKLGISIEKLDEFLCSTDLQRKNSVEEPYIACIYSHREKNKQKDKGKKREEKVEMTEEQINLKKTQNEALRRRLKQIKETRLREEEAKNQKKEGGNNQQLIKIGKWKKEFIKNWKPKIVPAIDQPTFEKIQVYIYIYIYIRKKLRKRRQVGRKYVNGEYQI